MFKQIKFYVVAGLIAGAMLWLYLDRHAQWEAGHDAAIAETTKANEATLKARNQVMREHIQTANKWRLDYEHEKEKVANIKKGKCWYTNAPPEYDAWRLRVKARRDKLLRRR